MPFYLVKVYNEADGENIFGPDLYITYAENQRQAMNIINQHFLMHESIQIKELELLPGEIKLLGTLLRDRT